MKQQRHQSFEPVTVRAAARLVHFARIGRIQPYELDPYLAELVRMDTRANGNHGLRSLRRLAFRHCALGRAAGSAPFTMTRSTSRPQPSMVPMLHLLPEGVDRVGERAGQA